MVGIPTANGVATILTHIFQTIAREWPINNLKFKLQGMTAKDHSQISNLSHIIIMRHCCRLYSAISNLSHIIIIRHCCRLYSTININTNTIHFTGVSLHIILLCLIQDGKKSRKSHNKRI